MDSSNLSLSRPPVTNSSLFSQPSASKPQHSTNPYQLNNGGQSSADSLKSLHNRPGASVMQAGRSYSLNNNLLTSVSTASQTDPMPSIPQDKPAASNAFDPKDDLIQDLQSDITKITKCVTCVICQDLLFEPYSLGCGHIFCYTCLLDWLKHKKTCPECRSKVTHKPAPAYLIRDMIDTIVLRIELQSPHDEGQATRKQQAEALQIVERDKKSDSGLFQGLFNRPHTRAVIDAEDGILRCPSCTWEIQGRICRGCGRTFHRDELPDGSDLSETPSDISDTDTEDDSEDDDDDDTTNDNDSRLDHGIDDHEMMAEYISDDDDSLDEHLEFESMHDLEREITHHAAALRQRNWGENRRNSGNPWANDSDEEAEGDLYEEDSDLDGFIARDDESLSTHQSPISISSVSSPVDQRILDQRRQQRRRQVISDDDEDDEDEDEDEDASSVSDIQHTSRRNNRYYSSRNPIVISSDNEEEEGLIPGAGYSQLEHDTTGDDEDEDDTLSDTELAVRRGYGTASTGFSTSRASDVESHGTGTTSRMSSEAPSAPANTATSRTRRRRSVHFAVPNDADEEEGDSDLGRDDEGDLDMDRHSRGGSEPVLQAPTNNRRRAHQGSSNRQTRTSRNDNARHQHQNQRQQDNGDDESSDDSLPVQRRRRVTQSNSSTPRSTGHGSSSSSRRHHHHHPHRSTAASAASRAASNRPRMDANVRRLLGLFHQQRTDQQFEQLGRMGSQAAADRDRSISPIGNNTASRHGLDELDEPGLISGGHLSASVTPPPRAAVAQGGSSSLAALSSARTHTASRREASFASPSMSPPPSLATISSFTSEPAPFEFQHSNLSSSAPEHGISRSGTSSVASPSSSLMDQRLASPPPVSLAVGTPRMRRRSNRDLRDQSSNSRLREAAQARPVGVGRAQPANDNRGTSQPANDNRGTSQTVNDEERRHRARQVVQQRQEALGLSTRARNSEGQASSSSNEARRLTRSGTAPTTGSSQQLSDLTLQQRFQNRRADTIPSRESLTPTPTASSSTTNNSTAAGSQASPRTESTVPGTRRRAVNIGSSPSGASGGPLWVINDD